MGHAVFETLRAFIVDYGYLAIALALLCENAGIPVPGETTLLLASFLVHSQAQLHLGWIIVVGTCAATVGDNLGYLIGHSGGRPLIDRYQQLLHISIASVHRAEKVFGRYGPATIFFARFIFGMRVVAGPMAGVLRMPWKAFAIYNLLGAVTWVAAISAVGYLFGAHWGKLQHAIGRVDLVLLALAIVAAVLLWRRWREQN